MTKRILIIGGTGTTGGRIVQMLSRLRNTELLIAARDAEHLVQYVEELQERAVAARAVGLDAIGSERPDLVIDASGPARGRDMAIPRACIAAASTYLDLAEDRAFVSGIDALDAQARAAGAAILPGAGLLPAFSMAAAEVAAEHFDTVDAIRVTYCPGNQVVQGRATYASVLDAAARPYRARRGGTWRRARAWRQLTRVDFPMLGRRLVAECDAPDLALMVQRWPTLRDGAVQVGSEFEWMMWGLWSLGWVSRLGGREMVTGTASSIEQMARSFSHFGGDASGLSVVVEGRRGGERSRRSWVLIARSGDDAYLAAAPVAALARRVVEGGAIEPGARPARIALHDILAELREHDVSVRMFDDAIT